MFTREQVTNWLIEYGRAWEAGDFEKVTSLFSAEAVYHEDPFNQPMVGHSEIREYWKDGASDSQENVSFQFTLWTIDGEQSFAHWCASFTRINSQKRVKLDGIFRLKFQQNESGAPVCTSLQEWWHRRED